MQVTNNRFCQLRRLEEVLKDFCYRQSFCLLQVRYEIVLSPAPKYSHWLRLVTITLPSQYWSYVYLYVYIW